MAKHIKWTMPQWMEPLQGHIRNTGGNSGWELVKGGASPDVNLPLSTLQACVKSQVSLLISLHKAEKI